MTYVGDIVVSYPWDNYSFSEKIASYLLGYGKAKTKQELYDSHIISSMNEDFHKFNESYVREKEIGKSGQEDNYKKMKESIDTLTTYDISQAVSGGVISYSQGEELKVALKEYDTKVKSSMKEISEQYDDKIEKWQSKYKGSVFSISEDIEGKNLLIMFFNTNGAYAAKEICENEKDEFHSIGITNIIVMDQVNTVTLKWSGNGYN